MAIFAVPKEPRPAVGPTRAFTLEARSPPRPIGPHAVKFEIQIGERTRVVELQRNSDRRTISLDGDLVDAEAVEIAPGIFSILLNGNSHEVRVAPTPTGTLTLQTGRQEFTAEVLDPRAWRGRRH